MNREELIKELANKKYGSLRAFAEAIDIKYTTLVSMLQRGIGKAGVDNVLKICHALGIDADSLSNYKEETGNILSIYSQLEIPRQSKVYDFAEKQLEEQNTRTIITGRATAAGSPIDGDLQDSNAKKTIATRDEIPRGADEVIAVAGDSMEPLLPEGSLQFIHYQPVPDTDGQIMAVSIKDEGATTKKVYREGDKIRLVSINPKYPDMYYPAEDIRCIGKILIDNSSKT